MASLLRFSNMSRYPQPPPGYGYRYGYDYDYGAAQPLSYQPYSAQPYGAQPTAQPYGAQPTAQPYGAQPTAQPYGAQPYAAPPASSYGGPSPAHAPAPGGYPPAPGSYEDPFLPLTPPVFPPGTDRNIAACFQKADRDNNGLIEDKELQQALSSHYPPFSLRTVRLLMYTFTKTNTRKIGPKEFVQVYHCLHDWRALFDKVDRDMNTKIDANELREALNSLGFAVSPVVLDLLVTKFDRTGGKAIEYDHFIECCLTVKGLTEKFKERDATHSGSATFTYENFMLAVLPFLIA